VSLGDVCYSRGMRVLVACEFSGIVRDAFRARGHDAWSCDILPTEADPRWHIQGDAVAVTRRPGWDLIIAHPPCTDLASIGASSWATKQANGQQERAREFFMRMYCNFAPRVCVENPVGIMSTLFRKPDQYVDPWQFGDPYRKKTGLWLRGLPPLAPEVATIPADAGYWVMGQKRAKGADSRRIQDSAVSGKNHHGSVNGTRSHQRSKFFPGIARAMAEQWGELS
jgi:hypothetical protein